VVVEKEELYWRRRRRREALVAWRMTRDPRRHLCTLGI